MTSWPAAVALGTGAAALAVWTLAALRVAATGAHERRASHLFFAAVAWCGSLGALAAALGSAALRGLVTLDVPPDALSFVASFGRGALFAGGLVFIARWQAPRAPG